MKFMIKAIKHETLAKSNFLIKREFNLIKNIA